MGLNSGTKFSKRLTTAKLYIKRTGETYEHTLGNIVSWKRNTTEETATHKKSEGGIKLTDLSITRGLEFSYEFVLSEHNRANIEHILKAAIGAINNSFQASGTGSTVQFTSVETLRTYSLGAYNVSNVEVSVSAAVKVEGTDYILDAAEGRITILNGGSISSGSTVDVEFDKPAMSTFPFTGATNPQIEGDCTLVLTDVLDTNPVTYRTAEIHTFRGSIHVGDLGDNAEDFNQITLKVVCWTAPVVNVLVRT